MKLGLTQFVASVPLVIAEERGLIAEAGLDLDVVRTTSSGEQLRQLLTGERDIAVTAIDNVFIWNEGGADTRVIAQIECTTPLGLYARADAGDLTDLAGRRFAVDALANGFALVARHLLGEKSVDVEYVEAGGVRERLEALTAGRADATLLGPPFDELAEREGLTKLADVNQLLPTLPGQGLVVPVQRLETHGGAIAAYLRVLALALDIAATMTDDEGIAMLASRGFPGRAAESAWQARPRTLVVDPAGLDMLVDIRRALSLLPPGYAGLSSLHDSEPLARTLAHN